MDPHDLLDCVRTSLVRFAELALLDAWPPSAEIAEAA
jgi:hypothetical protein